MKSAQQESVQAEELVKEIKRQVEEFHSAEHEVRRAFDGNRLMEELFAGRCGDTKDSPNRK